MSKSINGMESRSEMMKQWDVKMAGRRSAMMSNEQINTVHKFSRGHADMPPRKQVTLGECGFMNPTELYPVS